MEEQNNTQCCLAFVSGWGPEQHNPCKWLSCQQSSKNTNDCHANNLPSTEQAVKTQPKQDKSFSFVSAPHTLWSWANLHHFWPFICCLSVVLWIDKGDFPKSVHTVHLCYNKKKVFVWTFLCLDPANEFLRPVNSKRLIKPRNPTNIVTARPCKKTTQSYRVDPTKTADYKKKKIPRTTIDWNNLEQEIVSSKTSENFKTQISHCPWNIKCSPLVRWHYTQDWVLSAYCTYTSRSAHQDQDQDQEHLHAV